MKRWTGKHVELDMTAITEESQLVIGGVQVGERKVHYYPSDRQSVMQIDVWLKVDIEFAMQLKEESNSKLEDINIRHFPIIHKRFENNENHREFNRTNEESGNPYRFNIENDDISEYKEWIESCSFSERNSEGKLVIVCDKLGTIKTENEK